MIAPSQQAAFYYIMSYNMCPTLGSAILHCVLHLCPTPAQPTELRSCACVSHLIVYHPLYYCTALCPTFASYMCLCISPHCLPPLYYLRAAGQLAWTGAQKQEDDECSSRAACQQFSQDAHNFHKMSTIYCFIFLSKNCAAFLKGTIQLFTLYL